MSAVAGLAPFDVSAVILDGRAFDVVVTGRTTNIAFKRTIVGASTVTGTVLDRDGAVQRSGILDRAVDLRLPADDGTPLWFRLAKDSSDGEGVLTLVFESRVWARLAAKNRPRSMLRRKVTAAQFLAALVDEVKAERIPFICRQLDVRQRIVKADTPDARTEREKDDRQRSKGLASGAKITVKGRPATAQQRRIIDGCLREADRLGASAFVLGAVVMAITQESDAGALASVQTGNDDVGIFQQGRNWVTVKGAKDPAASTQAFLVSGPTSWKKVHGTLNTRSGNRETLIKRVQISVGGYGQWEAEARRTVRAFGAAGGSSSDSGIPSDGDREPDVEDYRYRRGQDGKRETTTACGLRLAEERNWRFFESGGVIYFDSDETLLRSRPRMTLTPTSEGLVSLPTHDRDVGVDVQQITFEVRATGWGAPPGSVVVLKGWGAAKDGRWLVEEIAKTDTRSATAQVTLTRAQKAKLEPPAEEKAREAGGQGVGALPGGKQSVGTSKRGVTGTPVEIINTVVLPLARQNGINATVASNTAANNRHGPTSGGRRSDHQGPPEQAWAADMGIGPDIRGGGNRAGATKGDALARDLARRFGIPWSGSGLISHNVPGYKMQLIWRAEGHFDHVHYGIHRT